MAQQCCRHMQVAASMHARLPVAVQHALPALDAWHHNASAARCHHTHHRHHRRRWHACSPASAAMHVAASAPEDAAQPPPQSQPHISVLLRPVLEVFQPLRMRTYVDGTLGAGGHACAVLQAHPELEMLVGIDLDPVAHAIAGQRLQQAASARTPACDIRLLRGNYRQLRTFLSSLPAPPESHGQRQGASLYGQVDAMLLDLGVSSMQLDTAERGFSFMRDGPLDMRMDPQASISAEDVVNTWSEAELGRIIRDYGEEKLWRQVARRITAARAKGPIRTTMQLVEAIGHTQVPSKGGGGGKRIHPATRTFQALRIAVNDEISKLEEALPEAIHAMAPGGRLAIISFHSLEDRAVKRAFARACGKPTPEDEEHMYGPNKFAYLDALQANAVAKLVTRKPLVAGEDESSNPRARSAKLRVIERLPLAS